eukprot:Colp12_sorted_trinity150504_noHs@8701
MPFRVVIKLFWSVLIAPFVAYTNVHTHTHTHRYGYFTSNNSYVICYSQPTINKIFDKIRKDQKYPAACGPYKIKYIRDLTTGYDNEQPDGKATLPVSASSQMITFKFENGAVATMRTSGTEPKIKWYSEIRGDISSLADCGKVESTLAHLVQCMVDELLEPQANGLIARSS